MGQSVVAMTWDLFEKPRTTSKTWICLRSLEKKIPKGTLVRPKIKNRLKQNQEKGRIWYSPLDLGLSIFGGAFSGCSSVHEFKLARL